MRIRFAVLVVFGGILAAASDAVAQFFVPEAETTGGVVTGQPLDRGGAVFLGIPFAQPPIGDLRWREPQPVKWQPVRAATAYSSACVSVGGNGQASGSEDCLYLNVWAPKWPPDPRRPVPVMLWLYGGANTGGSAHNPTYDGSNLAQNMNVIVVTANYRTGAMGFLALSELSQESPHNSSGNYALLDILMATKWIRNNAPAFGGDPKNITLFGQSSGAYDIQLLMTSPLSKELFQRAITESGQITSYYGAMPKAEAEQLGATIADTLNAPTGSARLAFLRGLPAAQVATAAVGPMATTPDTETGLLTNVDGWVLPTQPVQVFAEGRELPIPLIDGNNAREVTDTITYGYAFSNAAMQSRIDYKYGTTIDDPTLALAQQAILLYNVGGGISPPVDSLFGDVGSQWITDTLQRCGTVAISRYHSAHYPTYQYQFDRNTPGMESRGAFHTAEIPFVFGNPGSTPWTPDDLLASNVIQQYWTNFAKSGNPNGGSLPTWPRYSRETAPYMEFLVNGFAANERVRSPYCEIFLRWVSEYFLEGCEGPGREPKWARRTSDSAHSTHDDCPASHAPPAPPNYPH